MARLLPAAGLILCLGLSLQALAAPEGASGVTGAAEPAGAASAAAAAAPVTPLNARRRDHLHRRAQPIEDPHAVDATALALLPYAALATEVYCSAIVEHKTESNECAEKSLASSQGWERLKTYPNDLQEPHNFHGMIFATYWRDRGPALPVEIAVAFRGTDFKSPADWHANFRWIVPGRTQYDVLAEWVPRVIAESKALVLQRMAEQGRSAQQVRWQIVSTGHSLGGGLAQLFAYKSGEVQGAIAFDPSPVTGFSNCVTDAEVNCNVPIWRVYEHGEVLAYVRAVTRLFYMLSENITELEFRLGGGNPIVNHSMARFHDSLQNRLNLSGDRVSLMAADLFEEKPDCDCSMNRRPALYATVRDQCERLQALRDGARPLMTGQADPSWPELATRPALRPEPAAGAVVQAAAALP
jgi:pimeloyl-ACP methyl ester carboxylesterase